MKGLIHFLIHSYGQRTEMSLKEVARKHIQVWSITTKRRLFHTLSAALCWYLLYLHRNSDIQDLHIINSRGSTYPAVTHWHTWMPFISDIPRHTCWVEWAQHSSRAHLPLGRHRRGTHSVHDGPQYPYPNFTSTPALLYGITEGRKVPC